MKSTNFNDSDIQHFNQMASRWWDLSGPCQPLHEINPLRIQFIQSQSPVFEKSVLDVGCGGGILTEGLCKLGAHMVGLDLASESIQVAKQHAELSHLNIEYYCDSVESFATLHSQDFDIVTCLEMLEHVPDPESVIAHIATLLKPGGHAFFSTLNRTPKAFFQAIVAAEYLLKLIPKGTHRYHTFIRPSELRQTALKYGLRLQRMQGLTYHPFQRRYTLTEDCGVNYLMHFIKEAE